MEKLGQHFLINKNKIKKIIDALELKSAAFGEPRPFGRGDTVIEIGPGHGELTLEIKNQKIPACRQAGKIKIICIEKDQKLAQILKVKFHANKNIEIIEGDALKVLPRLTKNLKLKAKSYKIVGNIPYYITGYLLRIIGELENKPSLIVLTIQKEVAERIVAKPPKMNLLAASIQFWAEPKIIDYIPKEDFKPAPKVDSAIIKLNIRKSDFRKFRKINTEKYYNLIKILFKQPRKTILNNLISNSQFLIFKEKIVENLRKLKINPADRPQNLDIERIKQLSTLL